jgi:hypothetical protein
MKLLLALSLVLLLAVSASAKLTRVLIGPYSLSFDLNVPSAPSFIIYISNDNGSIMYVAKIFRDNKVRAALTIVKFDEWQYASFHDAMARSLFYGSMNRSGEIKPPGTTIDGHGGKRGYGDFQHQTSPPAITISWRNTGRLALTGQSTASR